MKKKSVFVLSSIALFLILVISLFSFTNLLSTTPSGFSTLSLSSVKLQSPISQLNGDVFLISFVQPTVSNEGYYGSFTDSDINDELTSGGG